MVEFYINSYRKIKIMSKSTRLPNKSKTKTSGRVRFPDMSLISPESIKVNETDIEVTWTAAGGLPLHMWLPREFLV